MADCFYRLGLSYLQLAKTVLPPDSDRFGQRSLTRLLRQAADSFYSAMVKKKLTDEKQQAAKAQSGRLHFEGDVSDSEDEEGDSEELLESAWQALEYARVICTSPRRSLPSAASPG